MHLVILESPYAGDVEKNVAFARECVRDCLRRGEAPIASHLLYTQPGILDDNKPRERQAGIEAGLAWLPRADYSVFYTDLGWSRGMLTALHDFCLERGAKFRIRGLHQPAKLPATIHEDVEALLKASIE